MELEGLERAGNEGSRKKELEKERTIRLVSELDEVTKQT